MFCLTSDHQRRLGNTRIGSPMACPAVLTSNSESNLIIFAFPVHTHKLLHPRRQPRKEKGKLDANGPAQRPRMFLIVTSSLFQLSSVMSSEIQTRSDLRAAAATDEQLFSFTTIHRCLRSTVGVEHRAALRSARTDGKYENCSQGCILNPTMLPLSVRFLLVSIVTLRCSSAAAWVY